MHEDPYPTYARLRAEAPVFYNEELDFFAYARHADVLAAFRDVDHYSNACGVSLDPAVFGPDAHPPMCWGHSAASTPTPTPAASASTPPSSGRTPTGPCRSSPWTRRGIPACAP